MPVLRSLVVFLVCASVGLGAELRTLAGATVSGDLVSLDGKTIVLKTADDKNVETPLLNALLLDLQVEVPPVGPEVKYIQVKLIDDTLLHCKEFAAKGKNAEMVLLSGHKVKVPLDALAYVLNEAQDPKVREEWKKILAEKTDRDLAVIPDADAKGVLNRLEGTFTEGSKDGKSITFHVKRTDRDVDVPLTRLYGMVLVRSLPAGAPEPLGKVYDTGNNVLVVSKVSKGEKGGFTLATVTGAELQLPANAVSKIDFSNARVTYLSDVEPAKVVEKSNTGRTDHYQRNKNLNGGEIRLKEVGGKYKQPFLKGLALHAYTELTFDLNGQYKQFEAVVGVDQHEDFKDDSHVRVTILADDDELFSKEVRRQDNPIPVKFSVKGAKQLRVIVRSVDLFDFGNHVDLADARVTK